jgi:DNA repair protein RecO (recombination protein O)
MLQSTRGVVLDHTRYGESSAIVRVYTRHLGMQSYMVNGALGRKKKSNLQLLQPLNLLELEVYHKSDKDINRIKEFGIIHPMIRFPFIQSRRAQSFLITEILSRALRSEGVNKPLFDFLEEGILCFDSELPGMENFHIWLFFNMTRFLGFWPHNNYSSTFQWFDLKEACFVSDEPPHPYYLKTDVSLLFKSLFSLGIQELSAVACNLSQRRSLLDALLLFYEIHHQGVGKIKSRHILEELFKPLDD